jgi:hypothetical protein
VAHPVKGSIGRASRRHAYVHYVGLLSTDNYGRLPS